jgi:hypothetical protein
LAQNPFVRAELVVLDSAEFTATAVDEWIDADLIADFEVTDLGADGFNSPSAVAAKNMWKNEPALSAGSKLEIDAIDCGRE